MLLKDFLQVSAYETEIVIVMSFGMTVSFYNRGIPRNVIEKKYGDYEVECVYVHNNKMFIDVRGDEE